MIIDVLAVRKLPKIGDISKSREKLLEKEREECGCMVEMMWAHTTQVAQNIPLALGNFFITNMGQKFYAPFSSKFTLLHVIHHTCFTPNTIYIKYIFKHLDIYIGSSYNYKDYLVSRMYFTNSIA